jgi:hypothetical protein
MGKRIFLYLTLFLFWVSAPVFSAPRPSKNEAIARALEMATACLDRDYEYGRDELEKVNHWKYCQMEIFRILIQSREDLLRSDVAILVNAVIDPNERPFASDLYRDFTEYSMRTLSVEEVLDLVTHKESTHLGNDLILAYTRVHLWERSFTRADAQNLRVQIDPRCEYSIRPERSLAEFNQLVRRRFPRSR